MEGVLGLNCFLHGMVPGLFDCFFFFFFFWFLFLYNRAVIPRTIRRWTWDESDSCFCFVLFLCLHGTKMVYFYTQRYI